MGDGKEGGTHNNNDTDDSVNAKDDRNGGGVGGRGREVISCFVVGHQSFVEIRDCYIKSILDLDDVQK